MRLAPLACLAVCLPLVATACSSGGSSDAPPAPLPTVALPSGCPTGAATQVPAACVTSGPDVRPTVPTDRYPKASARIPAVTLPAAPGDLAQGGNDVDPSVTTRTFTVTVPAGRRLVVTTACNGAAFLEAVTEPDSLAEVEMSCFEPGAISEITVADEVFQEAPRTFRVTVTAPAPSRWYAAIGTTADPLPGPAG